MTTSNWLLHVVEPDPVFAREVVTPSQYATATLAGIVPPRLRSMVAAYGAQFWEVAAQGIAPLIVGPPATYKSYAAAVLCRQVQEVAQVQAAWCTVPVMLTKMERKRYASETDDQIERWKDVPFLVVDDFAMARVGSWQYDVLVEIAMARFERQRPTVWTGNVLVSNPKQELREEMNRLLGIQLTRRVFERSEGFRQYVGAA